MASVYIPALFIPITIVSILYGKMAYELKKKSIEVASMSHNNQISQELAEASNNVMKLAFFVTGKLRIFLI